TRSSVFDSVVFSQVSELFQRPAQDSDDPGDLAAVELHLGVAVGQAVDRLILFEAVLLVGEPLDQFVHLGAQDERDVAHSEKPAALRAMHFLAAGVRHTVDDELPLAARTLEDFRNHARSEFTLDRAKEKGKLANPMAPTLLRARAIDSH